MCGVGPAQAWRSVLYPENWLPPELRDNPPRFETDAFLQDFSYAGYRRGEAPIPDVAGPVFDVVELEFGAHPNGIVDSSAAIQKAIDRAGLCAAGQGTEEDQLDPRCAYAEEVGRAVVYIPAGHYRLSRTGTVGGALVIRYSGVVLRGAGKDQTFLFNETTNMRGRDIIRVRPWTLFNWPLKAVGGAEAHITSDLLSPTTVIPLASVSGFEVGDWVVLRSDLTNAFNAEHMMADKWNGDTNDSLKPMFVRQIKAIDTEANEVHIDVPIRYYLKVRDNARMYQLVKATAPNGLSASGFEKPYYLEEVGLEGFSVGNIEHPEVGSGVGWGVGDYDDADSNAYEVQSYAIRLNGLRNGWIRDVHTYRHADNTTNSHVLSSALAIFTCVAVTVQDSSFQRAMYAADGGNGYMVSFAAAQEILLADVDVGYARHGFTFAAMSTSGNVILRGRAHDTGWRGIEGTANTAGSTGSDHHAWLSQSNLFDGTVAERDYFAAFWRASSTQGTTATHTVYWNVDGQAYPAPYAIYAGRHIVMTQQGRYGYAIGTRGPAPRVSISGVTQNGQTHPAYLPFDPVGRTAPMDIVEGEGSGDLLEPQSLYVDQLARRLRAAPPAGQVAMPVIAPGAGTYVGQVQVQLVAPTAGVELRYTIDGSEPTDDSPLYVGPIVIDGNIRLRARAFSDGMAPSADVDATYHIAEPSRFGVLVTGKIIRSFSPVDGSEVGTRAWVGERPAEGDVVETAITWSCDQDDVSSAPASGSFTLGNAMTDIGGDLGFHFAPSDLLRTPTVPHEPILETTVGPDTTWLAAESVSDNGSYIARVNTHLTFDRTLRDALPCSPVSTFDADGTVYLFEDDASKTSVWFAEFVARDVTWLRPPKVVIQGPTTFEAGRWSALRAVATDSTGQDAVRYRWSTASRSVRFSDPKSPTTRVMVAASPLETAVTHKLSLEVTDRFGLTSQTEVSIRITSCGGRRDNCWMVPANARR